MTNHCSRCNINIEKDRSHCPLCGKCVNENNIGKEREFKFYPDYIEWKKERINLTLLLTVILILVNIITLIIEAALIKKINVSWYTISGSVLVFVNLIWPITRSINIVKNNIIEILTLCLYLIFMEFYTKSYGWGIGIAVPIVLFLYDITILIFMLARGNYNKSILYPSIFIALLSTVIFSLNATIFSSKILSLIPSIIVFGLSWLYFGMLFLVRYRRIMKSIKKDFHL